MKIYGVAVHKEHEKDIIEYIERQKKDGHSVSATFKRGIEELIEKENGR